MFHKMLNSPRVRVVRRVELAPALRCAFPPQGNLSFHSCARDIYALAPSSHRFGVVAVVAVRCRRQAVAVQLNPVHNLLLSHAAVRARARLA